MTSTSDEATATARFHHRVDPRFVNAVRPFVRALRLLHPLRADGLTNVPKGPALLVGNHGLVGYETLLFFDLLEQHLGRLPIGLADRWFFKIPLVRSLLVRIGGTYGCPENALDALANGDLVVCYPGGVREVLKKTNEERYRLRWETSLGFARVAIRAQVPLVPFAAAGVDDTYRVLTTIDGSGEFLMGHAKYDLPLLWGAGPFPRPVRFWFRFGEPIPPGAPSEAHEDEDAVRALHAKAWSRTQTMLDELVSAWRGAYEPTSLDPASIPA